MSRRTFAVLAACVAAASPAARPTAGETRAFGAWVDAAFGFAKPRPAPAPLPTASRLPFSAKIDGRPFPGPGREWRRSAETRSLPDGARERTVRWTQEGSGLVVTCRLVRYADFPAAEWRLEFENRGASKSPLIEDVRSLDLETGPLAGPATLLHAKGDDATIESFAPVESALASEGDSVRLGPDTGRSSDRDLPYFDLATPAGGLTFGVGWSGSWQGAIERKAGRVSLSAGMRGARFRLDPGERVRMPSILMLYHAGPERDRGTNLLRSLLLDRYAPHRTGRPVMPPICATVAGVDPDGTYEGPHLRPLPSLAKWGFEVFWSDMDPQHWYPGGFPDGTGNWIPDPAKYPRGLGPIGEAVRANGMEYLLWFEPERAAPGSALFVQHPDWLMKGPWAGGHAMIRMQDPAVRTRVLAIIESQIVAAKVDWARFDMNIERPASFWAAQDGTERQGLTEAHYVEGWYDFVDRLAAAHPNLKFDLCSAGGHRLDFESLRRGIPLWTTDMDVQGSNPAAQMFHNGGLARWIPLFGMPVFGREPSAAFRAALTAGNLHVSFSPETLMGASPAEIASVVDSVALAKRLRPNFLGDFHELFSRRPGAEWYGYHFHRDDPGCGMAIVLHLAGSGPTTLSLRGLDPRRRYDVVWRSGGRRATLTGKEMASLACDVPSGESEIVEYAIVR